MNIAIMGFRGTGKTAACRLLSQKLDKKLVSTDEEVVKITKMTIPQLVKRHGWEKFRDIESEAIESICDLDDCIIDTGGGAIMRNVNIANLKKNALVVLLTADAKTMSSRIKNSKKPSFIKSDFLEEIKDVIQEREPKFKRAADYAIDTSVISPEEACDLIIHYVQMEMK
ncbi:shikimate kinase [Candidatus Woesearchaeota archaeon]|nr:shikimate kinase [Candidatus Woesearchaeota archaeon]